MNDLIRESKRKSRRFDAILKKYWPPPSTDELVEARDRFLVLLRQRRELQNFLDDFKPFRPATRMEYLDLGHLDQLVLASTHLLGGEGTAIDITDKLITLTRQTIEIGAIFVSLDRMERGRLISSRTFQEEGHTFCCFTVTRKGGRILKEIRDAAKELTDALAELA